MNHSIQCNRRQLLRGLAATGASLSLPVRASAQLSANQHGRLPHWAHYHRSIVIDGLGGLFEPGPAPISEEELAQYRASGITAVNVTVPYPGDNYEEAKNKIRRAKDKVAQYPSQIKLITQASHILEAKKSGQIGFIIGFQSTEMFDDQPQRIGEFAQLGARVMQLSYNGPSLYGTGGLVKANTGLSELGREAIREMEKHRVLVDLSHSNKQTVAQALKWAKKPITLSHTGCNAIYQHPRNNDDQELKGVADQGGVVGIYLMPFLEGGDGEITANAFMRHLNHAIKLCGAEHVSVGSDQGVLPVDDTPQYREAVRKDVEARIKAGISAPGETPNRPPFIPQLNAINRMELIAWHMHKHGHSDDTIEKVLGTNLLKLYASAWGA